MGPSDVLILTLVPTEPLEVDRVHSIVLPVLLLLWLPLTALCSSEP